MTAHSAYFRAGYLFAQMRGGQVSPNTENEDMLCGWRGLSRAPLPIGEYVIDSAMAIRGLDFQPGSVSAARTFAETVLREWGMEEGWENTRLLASELVTNACTHARPRRSGTLSEWSIQVGLVHRGSRVRLLVFDPSYHEPALRASDRFVEGGCGLRLIEFFSSDWGWDILDGQGKVVWADITMSGRS